jgi:hypothetical protein
LPSKNYSQDTVTFGSLGKPPRVLHQDLLSEDPRKAGRDPVGSTVDANESAGLRDDPDDLPDAGNSTAINYLPVEVLLRAHLNDLVAAVCVTHGSKDLLGKNPEVVFSLRSAGRDSLSSRVHNDSSIELGHILEAVRPVPRGPGMPEIGNMIEVVLVRSACEKKTRLSAYSF